jgi:hypothetical protein
VSYFYYELYFIRRPQDRDKASLKNIAILEFCILTRHWLKSKYSQSGALAAAETTTTTTITTAAVAAAVTMMTTAATTYTVVIKFKNEKLHIYNCSHLSELPYEYIKHRMIMLGAEFEGN